MNHKYGSNNTAIKYVKNKTNGPKNEAPKFALSLIRSESDRYDNQKLMSDYQNIISGNCIYLPNFFCKTDDLTLFNQLMQELKEEPTVNMINWSHHKKHENPTF